MYWLFMSVLKERNDCFILLQACIPHENDSSRWNEDDQNAEKQSGQKVGLHATFADKIKPY
jgi:hypothetical protein